MKTKLIKFHFIILLILVIDVIITAKYNFGFNSYALNLLIFLLLGSGLSLFALNFKRLFKPFTFLKVYSTFYITIPLLVLFIWNINNSWSNSISSNFERTLSENKLVYRQYNYEIYEKTGVLDFLRTNCFGTPPKDYYIDKNYFIFKTRKGYFYFDYKEEDRELLKMDFFDPLRKIEDIRIENDSVFLKFNGHSIAFEIKKANKYF